jgi:protein TonB
MTALATNYRIFDLPWTPDDDESQRLKKTARALLLVFAALGIAIPLIPMTERPPPPPLPAEVIKLVLEPPPPPPPKPEVKKEEPKPEAKPEPKPVEPPKPVDRQAEARKKAEKSGLLAMKDQLEDLRDALEPTDMSSAPMIGRVEGPSRAERALVTSRTGVGSGGINTGSLSSGFGSGPGNLKGHAAGTASPSFADKIGDDRAAASRSGSGGRAARSREEIEIVFDRNKSAIYALYSRARRAQPQLHVRRGHRRAHRVDGAQRCRARAQARRAHPHVPLRGQGRRGDDDHQAHRILPGLTANGYHSAPASRRGPPCASIRTES